VRRSLGMATAAAAAVLGPAGVWLAGLPAWAWGLWIGEALGLGLFIWIRRTVREAFQAEASRPAKKTLGWHSTLRLILTTVVLIAVMKTPGVNLWGVVLGYTLVQVPALLWQARELSRFQRGVS
jgi:hypothetical protein